LVSFIPNPIIIFSFLTPKVKANSAYTCAAGVALQIPEYPVKISLEFGVL